MTTDENDFAAPRKYVAPVFRFDGFNCPFCGMYAHQTWRRLSIQGPPFPAGIETSQCTACRSDTWWVTSVDPPRLVWPPIRPGVPPHPDMPEDARKLYEEARDVAAASPRAAVALLRVSVDLLLREVVQGATGSLNDVVGMAVQQGLIPAAKHALDSLRVIGNDAVHPKQLVMDEEHADNLVLPLCELMNLAVEQLITAPSQAKRIFDSLPPGVLRGIEKRDNGA